MAMQKTGAIAMLRSEMGLVILIICLNVGRLWALDLPCSAAQVLAGATSETQVCVADLDCDGDLDLVLTQARDASQTLCALAWLENDGASSPTFIFHDILTTSSFPFNRIAVSDLDTDGRPDLVIGCVADSGVAWLQNDGAPSLQFFERNWPVSAERAASVDCADFNCDGSPDVLIRPTSNAYTLFCWIQDGIAVPHFSRFDLEDTNYRIDAVCIADLNSDGWPDCLTAGKYYTANQMRIDSCRWYQNNQTTTPTFTACEVDDSAISDRSTTVTTIFAHDIDKSGFQDVFVNWPEWFWHVTPTDNEQNFWISDFDFAQTTLSIDTLCCGDLNGDGCEDLLAGLRTSDSTGYALAWFENISSDPLRFEAPDLVERRLASLEGPVTQCFIADLNGDGHPDLITADAQAVSWRLNQLPNAARMPWSAFE